MVVCLSCGSVQRRFVNSAGCRVPGCLGSVELGGYVGVRRLGAGSYGTVSEVVDANGQRFALKLLRIDSGWTKDAQKYARLSFAAEKIALRALEKCAVRFVPRVIDEILEGGYEAFVMTLIDGKELDCNTCPDDVAVADVMLKILSIVDRVHQAGLVMRDLKPSNVVVRKVGKTLEPWLIDFGTATIKSAAALDSTLIFTEAYAAPEQRRGVATVASDVYQLAGMLASMATGLSIDNFFIMETGALNHVLPTFETQPDLARSRFRDIVIAASRPDPSQRVGTCGEFAAMIDALGLTTPSALGQAYLAGLSVAKSFGSTRVSVPSTGSTAGHTIPVAPAGPAPQAVARQQQGGGVGFFGTVGEIVQVTALIAVISGGLAAGAVFVSRVGFSVVQYFSAPTVTRIETTQPGPVPSFKGDAAPSALGSANWDLWKLSEKGWDESVYVRLPSEPDVIRIERGSRYVSEDGTRTFTLSLWTSNIDFESLTPTERGDLADKVINDAFSEASWIVKGTVRLTIQHRLVGVTAAVYDPTTRKQYQVRAIFAGSKRILLICLEPSKLGSPISEEAARVRDSIRLGE